MCLWEIPRDEIQEMICDRCGVKVTHSRVRRKRMGHIELAAPVVHIWFFKAMPSRLLKLAGDENNQFGKVIYFQDYVVVDPGETDLEEKQLLTEEEYRAAREQYGPTAFEADMGAEGPQTAFQNGSGSTFRATAERPGRDQ